MSRNHRMLCSPPSYSRALPELHHFDPACMDQSHYPNQCWIPGHFRKIRDPASITPGTSRFGMGYAKSRAHHDTEGVYWQRQKRSEACYFNQIKKKMNGYSFFNEDPVQFPHLLHKRANPDCGHTGEAHVPFGGKKMTDAYILEAVRSPIGKRNGTLSNMRPDD